MPTETVDLGDEGLAAGGDIDPYLEQHFRTGVRVEIPSGEYESTFSWWSTAVEDAAICGHEDGCVLRRPEGVRFEDDDGSDLKIHEHLQFDGHVVIENLTVRNKHGWHQNRLDHEGMSPQANLDLRNVNMPDGTVGFSDTYFGRVYGEGQVKYSWCYFSEFANATFYQLESGMDCRQVFDGCTFRNVTQAHRGGTREYTIRNCAYIMDGPCPEFCEEEYAPCTGDPWGGSQRPFKMDQDYAWEGRFENLHFYATDEANLINVVLDFQDGQPGIAGTMEELYIYNESSTDAFNFEWDAESAWEIRDVHLTGPGNLDVPAWIETVDDPEPPVSPDEIPVWTPNGRGMPLVDSAP